MRETRAILFDLDDTLYPYRAFVRSGFRAVGQRLARERGLPARSVVRVLRRALVGGARGRELQALCERFSLPASLVPSLAAVIREHTPSLNLPESTVRVLSALRGSWRIGVLTNGTPRIQRRKVEALGLELFVDAVVFASEYGDGSGKPAAPAFHAALDRLGTTPEDTVFVGDDRHADIDGATAVGMSTIHLVGYHQVAHNCAADSCGVHINEIALVPEIAERLRRRGRRVMRFEIGGRRIGVGEPLFVIAELGLNHGGSVDSALAMVDAAAAAGAAAVKVQTIRAEELVAASCPPPAHVAETSLRQFFQRFELDRAAHIAIAARAKSRGLAFIATPFSESAVQMLVDVGVQGLKIASGDLTYDGLIAAAAGTGLPLILSTGMSTLAETAHAVAVAREHGARSIALLHCVSSYPVPEGSQNLRVIQTLEHLFDVPVGLSDHARDTSAIPIVVALGGSIYERHLMLAGDTSVDAAVSSTPAQFGELVELARCTELALGHGRRECLPAEAINLTASRRALHSTRAIGPGHTIGLDDIAVLRPSCGLSPALRDELIGTVIRRPIEAGAAFLGHDLPSVRSQSGAA